jgi:hypothetical protein
MRPGGSATSRISESAVTLLPHPDSPTIAERLAALELERNAVDRLYEPARV